MEERREFIRHRRAELRREIADGMPTWSMAPEPPAIIPVMTQAAPGESDLRIAAKSGDIDAIEERLAEGADINAWDNFGATPLNWAAMAGHTQAFQIKYEYCYQKRNHRNELNTIG